MAKFRRDFTIIDKYSNNSNISFKNSLRNIYTHKEKIKIKNKSSSLPVNKDCKKSINSNTSLGAFENNPNNINISSLLSNSCLSYFLLKNKNKANNSNTNKVLDLENSPSNKLNKNIKFRQNELSNCSININKSCLESKNGNKFEDNKINFDEYNIKSNYFLDENNLEFNINNIISKLIPIITFLYNKLSCLNESCLKVKKDYNIALKNANFIIKKISELKKTKSELNQYLKIDEKIQLNNNRYFKYYYCEMVKMEDRLNTHYKILNIRQTDINLKEFILKKVRNLKKNTDNCAIKSNIGSIENFKNSNNMVYNKHSNVASFNKIKNNIDTINTPNTCQINKENNFKENNINQHQSIQVCNNFKNFNIDKAPKVVYNYNINNFFIENVVLFSYYNFKKFKKLNITESHENTNLNNMYYNNLINVLNNNECIKINKPESNNITNSNNIEYNNQNIYEVKNNNLYHNNYLSFSVDNKYNQHLQGSNEQTSLNKNNISNTNNKIEIIYNYSPKDNNIEKISQNNKNLNILKQLNKYSNKDLNVGKLVDKNNDNPNFTSTTINNKDILLTNEDKKEENNFDLIQNKEINNNKQLLNFRKTHNEQLFNNELKKERKPNVDKWVFDLINASFNSNLEQNFINKLLSQKEFIKKNTKSNFKQPSFFKSNTISNKQSLFSNISNNKKSQDLIVLQKSKKFIDSTLNNVYNKLSLKTNAFKLNDRNDIPFDNYDTEDKNKLNEFKKINSKLKEMINHSNHLNNNICYLNEEINRETNIISEKNKDNLFSTKNSNSKIINNNLYCIEKDNIQNITVDNFNKSNISNKKLANDIQDNKLLFSRKKTDKKTIKKKIIKKIKKKVVKKEKSNSIQHDYNPSLLFSNTKKLLLKNSYLNYDSSSSEELEFATFKKLNTVDVNINENKSRLKYSNEINNTAESTFNNYLLQNDKTKNKNFNNTNDNTNCDKVSNNNSLNIILEENEHNLTVNCFSKNNSNSKSDFKVLINKLENSNQVNDKSNIYIDKNNDKNLSFSKTIKNNICNNSKLQSKKDFLNIDIDLINDKDINALNESNNKDIIKYDTEDSDSHSSSKLNKFILIGNKLKNMINESTCLEKNLITINDKIK